MTVERTDHELLLACRVGHEDAARHLYARLGPVLLAYARTILHDRGRAEDAVQSAMCTIYKLPVRRLKDVRDVKAWLMRTVRNEALMLLRTDRRAAAREEEHARRSRSGAQRADADGLDDVHRAIESLPLELREIVVMKHSSGMTFEQMAEATGQNRNTIASRYRTALQQLRALMGVESGTARRGDAGSTRREVV